MKIFAAIGLICALSWSNALNAETGKRIIGGSQATRNQFPYMVAIHDGGARNRFLCAGAILSPKWVTSSANCLRGKYQERPYKVIAGKLHVEDHHQDVQIVSGVVVVISGGFRPGKPYYDMAMLYLETPLNFNEAVKPVALPEKDKEYSGDAVLSGWGLISTSPPLPAKTLQYVQMPIITNEECNAIRAESPDALFLVKNNMLCTHPSPEQSACFGDRGGPLVQDGVLIGILVSHQCTPGFPNMFTKVSAFRVQLERALSNNE